MLREVSKKELIQIRRLQMADVINHKEAIHELLRVCFKSTYGDEVLDTFIDAKYNGLVEYLNKEKAYIFGAINEQSLIGFLWGYPVNTPLETVFHIAYISVLQSGRRIGIGEKLIDKAEKECRKLGLKHVELIVGSDNSSALSFYNHCGYTLSRYYLRKEMR